MLAATLNAVKHGFYRRRGEDAGTCGESLKEGISRRDPFVRYLRSPAAYPAKAKLVGGEKVFPVVKCVNGMWPDAKNV